MRQNMPAVCCASSLFVGAVFCLAPPGKALAATAPPPPIYISPEEDDDTMRKCGLSHSSAVAAVLAALRYNRVASATEQEWLDDKALRFSISITALESCAVALSADLGTSTFVTNPVDNSIMFAEIVFYDSGAIFTGSNMQSRLNDRLRRYLDEALAEYERKRQRAP